MNEGHYQSRSPLHVEPGDIVVTRDGTRRCIILKKEIRYGTNTIEEVKSGLCPMPYYTLYSLFFRHAPNLVGQTDHNIPLFERAWRKLDNENN